MTACSGCGGEAIGRLALRFYCSGHQEAAGWIISAIPSCGPCARKVRQEDVASAAEIESAATITRITHDAEPSDFVICLKPLERPPGVDATKSPETPAAPTEREKLEAMWGMKMGAARK